jgi:threonine/homoserine/homoserine lactone efflux protein
MACYPVFSTGDRYGGGAVVGVETSLIAGAAVGLSIAVPFGPASMLCVQRTLGDGFYTGLATGLGVATVHLTYGTLASLSASRLQITSQHAFVLPVVASLLLMFFSVRVLKSTVVLSNSAEDRTALRSAYCGAIGLGFLNPFTPVLFAAASPNLISKDPISTVVMVFGVFVGSFMWWSILSGGVSFFRTRLTARVLNLSNKIAGLVLGAMAVSMLARTCLAAM